MNILEKEYILEQLEPIVQLTRKYHEDYEHYNEVLGEGWAKGGFNDIFHLAELLLNKLYSVEVGK